MANTTFLGNVRENGDGLRTSIAGSMCATANFHIVNTLTAGDGNVQKSETDTTSVVYISSVDRVAVMYMNTNTTYPEAVIGQITGSSISFGTPITISTDIQSVPVYDNFNFIVLADMDASDTCIVKLLVQGSTNTFDFYSQTYLSIYLVC